MRSVVVHAPGEVVAVGAGAPRTAADLEADAAQVAAHLAQSPPGEVVLVCSDRYHFAVGLLGAWGAGHAVRIPPNGQPESVRLAAEAPVVRALLHDRDDTPGGTDLRGLLLCPAPAGRVALPPLGRCRVLVTTSGSTGAQQTWEKTGEQLIGEAAIFGRLFGVGKGARVLGTVPPLHIYGLLCGLLTPLASGAVVLRAGPLHVEEVISELERHRVSFLVTAPAHLASLAAADRLPPLTAAFSAGSPLPEATARALRERHGWRTIEIYGSTETGAIGWREAREGELWVPYPDVVVTEGEDGGALVDSPRAATNGIRPFPLADRIEVREGGRFILHGRMDGLVKVGGKRVALREIEERLLALEGVRDAAAVAQPSPGVRGQEIWVAVVASGWTPERLREALSAWLDPVTLPRRIRVVDALPREASGKLPRERLMALLEAPSAPVYLEPEAEEVVSSPPGTEARRLTFTVAPDLRWFEGHFPGSPVLPGVAQLEGLVVRQAERLWPGDGEPHRVKRLKFSRLIRPGERIWLLLERDAARGTVSFVIDSPEGRCTSGTLLFGAGGSP